MELASKIDGVDVIIGDSHTLLGDFDALGLNSSGPYQQCAALVVILFVLQPHGNTSQIVGELDIAFNDKGEVPYAVASRI